MSNQEDDTSYIYLFVRQDLSVPQQIVQTAHAVEQLKFVRPEGGLNHMVLIGAKDENQLSDFYMELYMGGLNPVMFYEPDIDQNTSIAVGPLIGEIREKLKKYRLMT
jgi:hypothetical protein